MTTPTVFQRHALRVFAVLAFTGYAAIMAPLVRQDLQLAAYGDTLELKRREVDAQLEQNDREIQAGKKRRDDVSYLRDERRILTAQGLQISREMEEWNVRRALWGGVYWAAFALAHAIALPLALWALAASSATPAAPQRSRTASTPRKRAARPKSTPPKLVEGMNP